MCKLIPHTCVWLSSCILYPAQLTLVYGKWKTEALLCKWERQQKESFVEKRERMWCFQVVIVRTLTWPLTLLSIINCPTRCCPVHYSNGFSQVELTLKIQTGIFSVSWFIWPHEAENHIEWKETESLLQMRQKRKQERLREKSFPARHVDEWWRYHSWAKGLVDSQSWGPAQILVKNRGLSHAVPRNRTFSNLNRFRIMFFPEPSS